MAPGLSRRGVILINLSGRGDKDVESVLKFQAERRSVPEAAGPRPIPHGQRMTDTQEIRLHAAKEGREAEA